VRARRTLGPGALVLLSLHNPREKFWGVLQQTTSAGIVVRGLDVNTYEDWLVQEAGRAEPMVGPTSVFFPIDRVERMELDETVGPVESLASRFAAKTGKKALDVLTGARR
jgi:hypothetical protein